MAEGKPGGGSRVAASLSSIVRYFEALPDPRHQRNRRHLLVDVITIAVCGTLGTVTYYVGPQHGPSQVRIR